MVQNEKKICLWRSISQESYIILYHSCVKGQYLQEFSSFFQSFEFLDCWGGGEGVKEQKIAQNDKKFCLSHLKSLEPYIIWSSFVVYNSKMIISLDVFFIFQNFDFLGSQEGQRAKNGLKRQKLCPLHFISQEPYII